MASDSVGGLAIRLCSGLEELQACVRLQQEVWKFTDIDSVPLRLFVVAQKIGGQVIGAFDGSEMAGFAMSLPGTRDGHVYLHSHMLAVREGFRDQGLGRRMKMFQREDALRRGIELIEWTFDPLEIKNSWLNLERLGAVSRRYVVNQYGITSSPLQGGLPSDRFVAEWWLKARRVEATLTEGKHAAVSVTLRVPVPAQIYQWKADPAMRTQAAETQRHNREAITTALQQGMLVVGYERDAQGNGAFLLAYSEENDICLW